MSVEKYKDIIAEIESLPQGGITYKKINGKEYAYYQWREDGKQRSRRAKDDELESLMAQIERRKELEDVLKEAGLMTKSKAAKPRKAAEKKPASKAAKTTKTTKTAKAKEAAKAAPAADAKIESRWLADERKAVRTALYYPGESDAQAEELIAFLLEDEFFDGMAPSVKAAAAEALNGRMKAFMLEDMLHLETKTAKPDCEVFSLHMEKGVFEMVIADPKAKSCELYEIKHCNELSRAHAEYLLDDTVCAAVAERYGEVTGKFVIYNGKTINVMESGTNGKLESVKYWNAEKYVEDLKK